MNNHRTLLVLGLLAISLAACSSGAGTPSAAPSASMAPPVSPSPSSSAPAAETPPSASSPAMPSETLPPEEPELPKEATLLAIGDIMVHMPQLPAYYDAVGQSYDFTPWFERVKPIFAQGDWVIGNLETPIAGKDLKYSGYPRFNAPDELALAIKDAGVQLLSTANNHSLDRGFPGVVRTMNKLRKAGLVPIGTSVSAADRKRLVIEERNGIRMGFLAYTYGTNGIPIPSDRPYAVELIDPSAIKRDISRVKEAGADVVTVSLHFGVEYQRMPNGQQTELARELIAAGADILLGSHPHVVQPYEEIAVPAEDSVDGTARKGIVVYSLGNFISNQTGSWKDVGLIFGLRLVKTREPDGSYKTTWDRIVAEPTWVHIRWKQKMRYYTVVPLRDAVANRNIPVFSEADYAEAKTKLTGLDRHLLKLDPALVPSPFADPAS